MARKRVDKRVAEGGHDIPTEVIERRYYLGISNFFTLYKDLVDFWALFNMSANPALNKANAPAWVFVCKNTFFYSIFQRKIKKIFYPKQTPQAKQRARVTSI